MLAFVRDQHDLIERLTQRRNADLRIRGILYQHPLRRREWAGPGNDVDGLEILERLEVDRIQRVLRLFRLLDLFRGGKRNQGRLNGWVVIGADALVGWGFRRQVLLQESLESSSEPCLICAELYRVREFMAVPYVKQREKYVPCLRSLCWCQHP